MACTLFSCQPNQGIRLVPRSSLVNLNHCSLNKNKCASPAGRHFLRGVRGKDKYFAIQNPQLSTRKRNGWIWQKKKRARATVSSPLAAYCRGYGTLQRKKRSSLMFCRCTTVLFGCPACSRKRSSGVQSYVDRFGYTSSSREKSIQNITVL